MKNSWSDRVCQSVSQSVSQCVCPRIFGNTVGTAGPIGTGVPAIDVQNRRNDDSTDPGSTGGTWHVARAAA